LAHFVFGSRYNVPRCFGGDDKGADDALAAIGYARLGEYQRVISVGFGGYELFCNV
jgi:hypothetical protein